MEYITVYNLKEDKEKIGNIQRATLTTDYAGLKIQHGLFCSEEWWEAIEKGLLSENVIEGTISRVYMSGHGGNYPEFEIKNVNGATQWTREGDDKYYVVGNKVRLTYVMEKFKKPSKVLGEFSKIVLSIEIEK